MIRTVVLQAAALLATATWPLFAEAAPVRYSCDDGTRLAVTFSKPATSPGTADLLFEGSEHRIRLSQVLSADGGRYVSGTTQFWIRGQTATLTQAGASLDCRDADR